MACFAFLWVPASAGMTGVCGNDGAVRGRRGSAGTKGALFPQPRRYLHDRFLDDVAKVVQLLRRDRERWGDG